jgi:hypothetical protein
MKKYRLEKRFLEELSIAPSISIACEKVGLSRQTIYRWMDFDKKFQKKVNLALSLGNESISDLAESKVFRGIKKDEKWAVKYWLDHHKYNYMKSKPKDFWFKLESQNEKRLGGMFIVDMSGRVDYIDKGKKYETTLTEDDAIFSELDEKYHSTIFKIVDGSKLNKDTES